METGNGELKGLLTASEEGLISGKFLFDEKAVLYSKIRPYLMKVARPDFAGLCSADVYPLEPSLDRINRDFLYHLLLTPGFTVYAVEGSARAGMPKVNRDHLFAFKFLLPTLPEQQRIVAILDEALDGIATAKANAEKNLQNAREVFDSHLRVTFTQKGAGWPRVRIEDACESIMDCFNRTAPKVDGPTPFKMIRTTNVRNGRIDLTSVNFVTEEVYKIWTRRQIPQQGDVILTREAPMGEVGILESDEPIFLGQRLVQYRANTEKLNNRFLLYALLSEDLQGQIRAFATGSTVQHMRVPDTKNLLLPLPSLKIQEETVAILDSLREGTQALESNYKQKIDALDDLKRSLLHRAFNGDL